MLRREFLSRAGVCLGVGLTALRLRSTASESLITGEWSKLPPYPVPELPIVNARPDRFVRMTVGLRPFRAAGPNLAVEKVGRKTVVHNYGHGGSGWSLSWGTAEVASANALGTGEREIAVVGCGVVGLTTAALLQRAGAKVTIYAKARPPKVTSSLATGVWSPDSRICLAEHGDALAPSWEKLCRTSYKHYQFLLGLPGQPVRWCDSYSVSDIPWDEAREKREREEAEKGEPEFAHYHDRVADLMPEPEDIPDGAHPFQARFVRRSGRMVFNLTQMAKKLVDEFHLEGGQIHIREFHTPADFDALPEKTIVNATGLGAKDLFGDSTMTPVRGQLGVLIPQPEINYSLSGEGFSMVPRHDGLIVQTSRKGDFGGTDTAPDREEAEGALLALAKVCAGMRRADT